MATIFRTGAPRLFSTKIEPSCSYCANGAPTQDGAAILCIRSGVVMPTYACRRFIYDPISRKVTPKKRLPTHSAEDFSL